MIPLAHYWGIDEVGVFVLPAIVAIVLLRWAEKKARLRQESERDEEKASVDD
jgi:hypothetical protein